MLYSLSDGTVTDNDTLDSLHDGCALGLIAGCSGIRVSNDDSTIAAPMIPDVALSTDQPNGHAIRCPVFVHPATSSNSASDIPFSSYHRRTM
jgi:hypothetical protein